MNKDPKDPILGCQVSGVRKKGTEKQRPAQELTTYTGKASELLLPQGGIVDWPLGTRLPM